MSDPRETLAHIRARAERATEGPWGWAGEQDESFPQGENSLIAQGDPEREVIGSWGYDAWGVEVENPDDAEFIAAARTDVPRLVDALEGVLAMHTPKDNGRVAMCCSCEQWIESSDDEACIEYPCPTVEAITDALNGGADASR